MNLDLSIDAKRAGLKASASVVSVVSLTGGRLFFACSGTIIKCEDICDGTYVSTILTSASLLRCSTCLIPSWTNLDTIPDDIKVEVRLSDDRLFDGQVFAYDFHYNIALIKMESDAMLPTAKVRLLEDSISAGPVGSDSFYQLRPHSDLFQIQHGDMVVALGRHFMEPYYFMALPTTFSIDRDLDCIELFTANCNISRCGVGGPLVNRYGEVIGVNFYGQESTPFLPINIAIKCLEHYKKFGKFCRPYLGMEMHNLYAASVEFLDKFLLKFPDTFKGVFVEKVREESPAHRVGIVAQDVIIQCNGNFVPSFLEFMGMIWDKVGESVELLVLRASNGAYLNLKMVVDETSPDQFNSWPLQQPNRTGKLRSTKKRRIMHCCGFTTE